MKELLKFISEHLIVLAESFRFVDSKATTSFGGNACIVLESTDLRIRLIRERLKLFIEFQSTHGLRERWYAWDIVREMIFERPVSQSVLDPAGANELLGMLPALETVFSKTEHLATEGKLDALENKRSKRLFGV